MQDVEGDGEGEGDQEADSTSGQDDFLPPLARLDKFSTSKNMFNRQLGGRLLLDTLRAVADSPVDVASVLGVIARLAEDTEPAVRCELMEQLPNIAMLCHEDKDRLHHLVADKLLPLVLKFLGDTDNQVCKSSQDSLMVLIEQGLIDLNYVEDKVCPYILMLTDLDSLVEFHPGAVALMGKIAPLIGRKSTENLFLEKFAFMCASPVFYVRKVCAATFGEFCSVVSVESLENTLLPRFVDLCKDEIWGVRKACAEVFMSVSCACTMEMRKSTLASLFANLLSDPSRWVRMSAFRTLGPFISTFADPRVTGLTYNRVGELTLSNPDSKEYKNILSRLTSSQISDSELAWVIADSKSNTEESDLLTDVAEVKTTVENSDLFIASLESRQPSEVASNRDKTRHNQSTPSTIF